MKKHRGHVLVVLLSVLLLLIPGKSQISASSSTQLALQPECAVTAQLIGGQGFNFSGQGFNFSGQGFNFSGQGFNLSGQGFNLSGQGFNLSGQGFNLSGQGFNFSGQNYADPNVVANEILNNLANPSWLSDLLNSINLPTGVGYGEAQSAVIIVDEGLHLLEVQEVLTQLAATMNMSGIRIETIDISSPSINYRVANIANAIDSRVQLLRSQGVTNTTINMSLAFIPCSDPVTGFNFDSFIAAVNASNQGSAEVTNAPVVPFFECVYHAPNGKRYARFGFESDNTRSVTIPAIGYNNVFIGASYPEQPEVFEVGRHTGFVEVLFGHKSITWKLRGPDGVLRTAVASKYGTPCSAPLPAATQAVEPILECVYEAGNGNYVARFGYRNANARTVYISTNGPNKFIPSPANRGQNSHFLPGRHANAFEVVFNGADIRWQVKGPDGVTRSVVARPIASTCATDSIVIDLGDYLALTGVSTEDIPEIIIGYLNDTTDTSPLRDLLRGYLIESANPSSPYNTVAVVSSGNYRPWASVLGAAYPGEPLAPARWPETIAVSASLGNNPDQIWFFSHDGNIMARGAGYQLGTKFYVAGTSFAAPAVSLMLAQFGKFDDACIFPEVNGVVYPPLRDPTTLGNVSLEGAVLPLYCDVPQNTPPIAADDEYTVNEDTVLTVPAVQGLLANDSDSEGDTLTATLVTPPANGQFVLAADGGFTYTPNLNYNGTESFTYVASDGSASSNVATIIIIVEAVNDAPSITINPVVTDEDTPVDITFDIDDVDGDPVTVNVSDPPNGSVVQTATGVNYTPDPDFNGTDSFTISISDGTVTVSKDVSITILAVNDPPVAENITGSVNAGESLPVTLVGTDVDGDTLSYEVISTPFGGSLSGVAPNLIYTANVDVWGTDTFTYIVTDTNGASSAVATVSITVNAFPVANAQSLAMDEDTALAITLSGSDAEGAVLTFTVQSQPAYGVLSGTAPNLTYTPNANFFGPDAFTFIVNDGIVNSLAATINITVNPVNDVPVANALSIVTNEDVAVPVTLSGSDLDGDVLSFIVVAQPMKGTLSGVAPNLTYTPNPDFYGADSFMYVANDGMVNSVTATVNITVNAVNDKPTCALAAPLIPVLWPPDHSMQPVTIVNVTDPDGSTVTITITSIRQDEPVKGHGHGNTSPDASGVGTSTALVRAERAAKGNGRVYYIRFQAYDGTDGACTGVVEVGVAHDLGSGAVPIGEGPLYDSTKH